MGHVLYHGVAMHRLHGKTCNNAARNTYEFCSGLFKSGEVSGYVGSEGGQ